MLFASTRSPSSTDAQVGLCNMRVPVPNANRIRFMDGVVREVNARVFGRGLKLVDGNENEWELNQLLFADDTVVVADSERKLCQLVTEGSYE